MHFVDVNRATGYEKYGRPIELPAYQQTKLVQGVKYDAKLVEAGTGVYLELPLRSLR